ncbi:MAG: response regulator transcription factor [Phycisphaerales bacterium]
MPHATVLVVEDDAAIRRGVADALRHSGYAIIEAPDGVQGLDRALSAEVDLVLLDILMPKMDGLTVLAHLRKAKPALPVIFLTARGELEDRVKGLKLGADDYVVKPFGASELLARVEAVLRRSAERPRVTGGPLHLRTGVVDFDRREVTLTSGERRSISEREADTLQYLAANAGRAIERDELLTRVWGVDPRGTQTRAVDMTIARLREVLADDPADPKVIITVRGKGYMLAADDAGGKGVV